jgi:leucyl aminopeptidase
MTAIRLSNGIVKDDVLVVGLSAKSAKGALQIEAGDLALDTKALLPLLNDVGATGKADEVIKIPGTTTRLIIFTGLGKSDCRRRSPGELLIYIISWIN